MLFEGIKLTSDKCREILSRAFITAATNVKGNKELGAIPIPVLEAHGQLSRRIRFLCEAAHKNEHANRARTARIRKIERFLNILPQLTMEALHTSAAEDWMSYYRKLLQLHEWMVAAELCDEAGEYEAIIELLIYLAQQVATESRVKIDPASMFSLLLMQVHLQGQTPNPQRKPRAKRRVKKTISSNPS